MQSILFHKTRNLETALLKLITVCLLLLLLFYCSNVFAKQNYYGSLFLNKTEHESNSLKEDFFVPRNKFYNYVGDIDFEFYQTLKSLPNNATLRLTSHGGIGFAAIEAAHLISEKNIKLEIYGECYSACVDFIFPSAKSITLIENPIIAIHGNPASRLRHAKELKFKIPDRQLQECVEEVRMIIDIWKKGNSNSDLLFHSDDNMEPLEFINSDIGCPQIKYKYKLKILKGDSLRNMFGGKIIGNSCADNNKCISDYQKFIGKNSVVIIE